MNQQSIPNEQPEWRYVRTIDELALVYQIPGRDIVQGEQLVQIGQPLSTRQRHKLIHQPSRQLKLDQIYESLPLSGFDLRKYQLPLYPSWAPAPLLLEQPWRQDPRFERAFHPKHPDDIEILLCSPAHQKTEVLWARIHHVAYKVWGYGATLLSTPATPGLGLKAGDEIVVRGTQGLPLPVYISPETQQLLDAWSGACESCGFDLPLTPPQPPPGLPFKATLPMIAPQAIPTSCPLCRGPMLMLARKPT